MANISTSHRPGAHSAATFASSSLCWRSGDQLEDTPWSRSPSSSCISGDDDNSVVGFRRGWPILPWSIRTCRSSACSLAWKVSGHRRKVGYPHSGRGLCAGCHSSGSWGCSMVASRSGFPCLANTVNHSILSQRALSPSHSSCSQLVLLGRPHRSSSPLPLITLGTLILPRPGCAHGPTWWPSNHHADVSSLC